MQKIPGILDSVKGNRKRIIINSFLFTLLGLISTWFILGSHIPVLSDFANNLWQPANILLHRLSPYDTQSDINGLKPIWFPVIIGFFLPLGALPIQVASNLWFLVGLLSMLIIVILTVKRFKPSLTLVAVSAIALAIFPSTATHFRLGQISLLSTLVMLILAIYHKNMKWRLIGLLLAISSVKPQLIAIFIPVFLIALFRNGGIRLVVKVIISTSGWLIAFTLPLFILYPNWIPDFVSNLSNNPNWAYPTPFTFIKSITSSVPAAIWFAGFYLLLGIGISIWLIIKKGNDEGLLWSIAITPVFCPVVWSWDFVLVYPLLLTLIFDRNCRSASNTVIGGYLLCLVIYTTMIYYGYVDDRYSVWVPILLLLVIIIGDVVRSKNKKANSYII